LAVISIQTGFQEERLNLTLIYLFIYANFPTKYREIKLHYILNNVPNFIKIAISLKVKNLAYSKMKISYFSPQHGDGNGLLQIWTNFDLPNFPQNYRKPN